MAQSLAEQYPAARAVFAQADAALGEVVPGRTLSQLCFAGPEEQLTDTINAQPGLLAASIAALAALQQEMGNLPRPQFFAGHSMGEYSALVAAGCVSFADGLRLVRERGRLMKAAGEQQPGRMAAVLGLDQPVVADVCAQAAADSGGVVQIANDNCPGQIVISGDGPGIAAAMAGLEKAGARKVVPLAVSIAAHSLLMQPAVAELGRAIDALEMRPPVAPLIGNTSGRPLTQPDAIRQELKDQLTGSVRWTDSMNFAVEAGGEAVVEIGPGAVLTGLMKRIQRRGKRLNVADVAGVRAFAAEFAS